MTSLQRAGGVAALAGAMVYVVGFTLMATMLNPGNTEAWGLAEKLAFVLERKTTFQLLNLFIYVFFGIVLVILTVVLHEHMKAKASVLMQIASSFGLIWAGLVIASGMVASVGLDAVAKLNAQDVAMAATAWPVIAAIQDGLGGGVEIAGGIWLLLVSAASLRTKTFPKLLDYLGLVVGLAGILTIAPMLRDLGAVFGVGQVFWFAAIGVLMLRGNGTQPVVPADARTS
nr:hypothetical protein [uncultured Rhodoferax sp.]